MTTTNDGLTAATRSLSTKLDWYKPTFKAWPAKFAGERPSEAMFAVAHALVKSHNPGVEALHIAMCMRDGGCTVQQFCTAGSCGPANNTRRRLVAAGYFKVTVSGKPYAFNMTLTARGEAAVLKHVAALATAVSGDADKPAKAKVKAAGKRKAKAKVKPADAPQNAPAATPEAPEATPAETPVADQPQA